MNQPAHSDGERLLAELLASRWRPLPDEAVARLVAQCTPDDWHAALRHHGVAGLLRRYAEPDALARLSTPLREALDREATTASLKALVHVADIRDIKATLEPHRIDWMLLKGIAQSQSVHGALSVRSVGDLDPLVSPDDAVAAAENFHAIGFTPIDSQFLMTPASRRQMMRATHQALLRSPRGTIVELHWHTGITGLDAATMLAAREPVELAGTYVHTVGHGLRVRYIAAHAARSACTRWKWGYDVLHLVENASAGERGEPAVQLVHEQMHHLLGITPPGMNSSHSLALTLRHYAEVRARAQRPLTTHRHLLRLEPNLRSRLRYLWRHATTLNPKPGETAGHWSSRIAGGAAIYKLFRRLRRRPGH